MKLKINCIYLHYSPKSRAISCNGANGQRCYNKRCPMSEINNYKHLCKDCWKLKNINCPNSALCLALPDRPHFESLQHAIDTGKLRV